MGEEACDKYYVAVTKYVEIDRKMTILYSADFSLKGEILAIGEPTGSYRGFVGYEEKGYALSKPEKIISDNLYLFGPYPEISHNDDIRENVRELFREEFQDAPIPAEFKSGSRMKEICHLLSGEICERYQKTTFTNFFERFKKWLDEIKRICLDKLDDEHLLYLLSYYCSDHLNYHEYRSREFEKWCQDRDNLFWCE